MSKIKIEVTALDIFSGVPDSTCFSPIANALTRQLDQVCLVYKTSFKACGLEKEIGLPEAVETFMKDFDLNKIVQPFSFDINL